MITISRAKRDDLGAIQHLASKYKNMMVITPELFNNTDIALQARDDQGALVGFLWCGLVAKSTLGIVDKVYVDPAAKGQHIQQRLYTELLKLAHTRGVKQLVGMIRQGNEFHDRSLIGAFKGLALKVDSTPYTFAFVEDIKVSLQQLGV